MSGPAVQYANGSGVEIAYQVLGDGPVDIVWVAGAMTHLDVMWEHAGYRRFCEQLASFSRLILFDKRGMGLSERSRIGTLEERNDDVLAVLDAVGSEQAALIGVSEGGPHVDALCGDVPGANEGAHARRCRDQGRDDRGLAVG